MKWYDIDKKKPPQRKYVVIYPHFGDRVAYWEDGKWWKGLLPIPKHYNDQVRKWAYVEYPKISWWKKFWRKIKKRR